MYKAFIKPCFDVCIAFILIVILLIPMLAIGIAVKVSSSGPILFMQKRVGKDNVLFSMPKFRSMYTSAPKNQPTHLLQNPEQWVTKVGKFLRKSSLDELPQLFSILTLKMSFVGPRPALFNQQDLLEARTANGSDQIRPGLTGWAQINGRDELPVAVKAKFDGEYSNALAKGGFTAFAMDCRCFFGTFIKVLSHDGVVEGGTGTMASKNESKEQEHISK